MLKERWVAKVVHSIIVILDQSLFLHMFAKQVKLLFDKHESKSHIIVRLMLVQETQTESNPLESANFQRTRDTQAQTDDDEAAKAERHNLDELRTTGAGLGNCEGLIKRSLSKG